MCEHYVARAAKPFALGELWPFTEKLERFGIATTIADPANRPFQFRVGLYANGWHDQGTMVGSQGTRSVYFDQIGVGTAFADADPNQW